MTKIANLTTEAREEIRDAVQLAVRYWPNDGRESTPREDIRSAFKMLRSHASYHGYIQAGIGAVSGDAYRYMDM